VKNIRFAWTLLAALAAAAQAKSTKVDCTPYLSAEQFLTAIGESGTPRFEKKHKGCNFVNEAGTRAATWMVTELSSDEEWTREREALNAVAGFGVNLASPVEGVGSDAYVMHSVLLFLSSNRKYRAEVGFAEKGASTPPDAIAAIRKQIAMNVNSALSN
jgi:hypothetical protein